MQLQNCFTIGIDETVLDCDYYLKDKIKTINIYFNAKLLLRARIDLEYSVASYTMDGMKYHPLPFDMINDLSLRATAIVLAGLIKDKYTTIFS